jgi:hypothetical protein
MRIRMGDKYFQVAIHNNHTRAQLSQSQPHDMRSQVRQRRAVHIRKEFENLLTDSVESHFPFE